MSEPAEIQSSPAIPARELFDPFRSDFQANPYPEYARFREEAPIHLGTPPMPSMPRCWYLFRYREVSSILLDERFGRDRAGGADRRTHRIPPQ